MQENEKLCPKHLHPLIYKDKEYWYCFNCLFDLEIGIDEDKLREILIETVKMQDSQIKDLELNLKNILSLIARKEKIASGTYHRPTKWGKKWSRSMPIKMVVKKIDEGVISSRDLDPDVQIEVDAYRRKSHEIMPTSSSIKKPKAKSILDTDECLKSGRYYCTKCKRNHNNNTRSGQDHLKYKKIVDDTKV